MGMLDLVVLWLLGYTFGGASMAWAAIDDSYQMQVQTQCSYTRYPRLCLRSWKEFRNHPVDIMTDLINKTLSETRLPDSYFEIPISQLEVQEARRVLSVTEYCKTLMGMSLKRLDQSLLALKDSPRKNKHDIQTWLSAALTFQQACKDSTDTLGLSDDLMPRISDKMDYLSQLTSNPLALVSRISGDHGTKNLKNSTKNRRAEEKSHGFPKWVSAKDRKLLQASTVKANAVVAQDGTGNYKTISEAMNAAPGKRFVIYVKAGIYKEKIRSNKDGITLIGDGKYSTVIVGHDSVAGGSSMPGSATFTITGDDFIARDIGFQNTAGPGGEQALALYVASDHSVFYRCSIAGYQDTLYALALRQFYRECDIFGTIDFIFGNAAAVFQSCNLALRKPHGDSYNVILANGRDDPGQNTGFSLQSCRITASSDFAPVMHSYNSYLGRPWKKYSRSVVMESSIGDVISSRGWVEWPGAGSYAKSLYFAEYSNTGPGAGTSNRVKWPGFHVIGPSEASKFTVGNLIAGTSWLPSTGVTFISGLQ
ncbi:PECTINESTERASE [Salix koriyanagi]|uniref:Pectinesterase n=1 Tax=Salix koriyanagi TaxID=2511006 RepID=A0A9Q0VE52_9ROSI|nr:PECTINESTERASE [Salix koriyanagi]